MFNEAYTDSAGVVRRIEGKVFGKELRVYRVYGDVTDKDGLTEVCQQAALQHKCETVTLKL